VLNRLNFDRHAYYYGQAYGGQYGYYRDESVDRQLATRPQGSAQELEVTPPSTT